MSEEEKTVAIAIAVPSERIAAAVAFAIQAHDGQMRGDGITPYVMHPIKVMQSVMAVAENWESLIIAAVLHDTVEDTAVTNEQIRMTFGKEVSDLVAEVTDHPETTGEEKRKAQINNINKLSTGALLLKFFDKLSNTYDLHTAPPTKWSKAKINLQDGFSRMYMAKAIEEFKSRGAPIGILEYAVTNIDELIEEGRAAKN